MIALHTKDCPERGRLLALTVIDGKEYRRLAAFADAMNHAPGLERDNTAETVYREFFTYSCDLDADVLEAAGQIASGIDLGDFDEPQEERRRIRELQARLVKATGENSQLEAALARCEEADETTSPKNETKEETDET